MSFDWDKFRELAETLRQTETEAAQRTAISRIYYAVYHHAKNYLENEGFQFRQIERSHRQFGTNSKTKAEPLRQSETRATGFGQIALKPIIFWRLKTLIFSSKGLSN